MRVDPESEDAGKQDDPRDREVDRLGVLQDPRELEAREAREIAEARQRVLRDGGPQENARGRGEIEDEEDELVETTAV